jgi:hypothetical protein
MRQTTGTDWRENGNRGMRRNATKRQNDTSSKYSNGPQRKGKGLPVNGEEGGSPTEG